MYQPNHSFRNLLFACSAGLLLSSCAVVHPPDTWKEPTAKEATTTVYGSFVYIEGARPRDSQREWSIQGELIAVQDSSIVVATADSTVVVPDSIVYVARLAVTENHAGSYPLVGLLMMVGSPWVNGAFCVITGTASLLTGLISNVAGTTDGHPGTSSFLTGIEPTWWQEQRKYARFPAGLPTGLRLRSIKAFAPGEQPSSQ